MRSIRVYLLVLVLGAMLPGALIAGVLVWRAFANERAATERRLLDSARIDASALDRTFAGMIAVLQTLAASPALDREDLPTFYEEGRRVQATQPAWYTVMLVTLDGETLLSTRAAWGAPLLRTVEPESLRRLAQTGEATVGVVSPSPTGGAEHFFPIRVPVRRDGRLKYALTAIVSVGSLTQVIPQQQASSGEWTRSILDPEGTIAVRTRGAENYVGGRAPDAFLQRLRQAPDGVSTATTREGVPVYAASSRGRYGWTAIVVVPPSALDAPMREPVMGLLAGGALLMGCGLGAVRFVSRRLAADLATATAAAEAVAEARPVPQASAHVAETHHLQRSLATAASLLEKRAQERDEHIRRADAARAEAEDANRTKDEFLAVLGHELRNPLAPALTAVELMKARNPDMFARERAILERQIAHMARLVNDLLDVSRLARGKVQLQRRRIELREAVDRAVDMARPLIIQHGHALRVVVAPAGLPLDADIDRIVQVLSNLLTNAARYTPSGGQLALTATARGNDVVVACEDNGPGLPPDLVPKLFRPFAQGSRALDRREGGLGLGLALARTFTELHDGAIHYEPCGQDGGSRFVVTLPLAPSAAPRLQPAAPALPRDPSQRILVVDDNADAREMLHAALDDAGHVLITAGEGLEAIAKAAAFLPDVAVLDIGLPGMDGYQLARQLRGSHPRMRLSALTGYGRASDSRTAAAAGFDAHCAKPIRIAELLDVIEGKTTV